MKTRYLALAFVVLLGAVATGFAADGQALSKDELQQFIPGSQVVSTGNSGAIRRWTNDPSGEFIASWESGPGQKHSVGSAQGKWHISDDAKYCVEIDWRHLQHEQWCAAVQKGADGKFGLAAGGSTWVPNPLEISK